MKLFLKTLLAITLISFLTTSVNAQDKEIGVNIGVTEYLGDLTYSHVSWNESKLGGGLFYRHYFSPRLNFKIGFYYGNISGWDGNKDSSIAGAAYNRDFEFYSHLVDIHAQFEYNILPFISGNKLRNWSPYIFGGVSVFNFNPKREFEGVVYNLQELGTSGQGRPGYGPKYALTQVSIPYGFGIKYSFKRPRTSSQLNLYLWNISVFISQNKTFTDFLDDVGDYYPDIVNDFNMGNPTDQIAAQLSDRLGTLANGVFTPHYAVGYNRGNPDYKDAYMWLGFSISKTFRKNTCFCF